MTRYAPLWQQGSTYPAAVDRGLLSTLWPASGSSGGAASGVANTMNVNVGPGTAAVALGASAGTALCRWDAAEVVTLTPAPPTGSSRIDLVVLQVRDNALDSGGNNDFIFQAIAGTVATPGPGPVPAVPANAYPICQLTVPGGAVNLNGVAIVDRRLPMAGAARAYRNGAWTTTAGSPGTIVMDSLSYGAGFNFATGLYTCPAAGLYLITGQWMFNSTAASQGGRAVILYNGTAYLVGPPSPVAASAGVATGATIDDLVACAAGDTLGLGTWGAPAGATGIVGPNNTMVAVRYLG